MRSGRSTTTSTRRTGEGIKARQKLIWLTVVAFVAGVADPADVRHHRHRGARSTVRCAIEPWLYVVFAAFAIIAAANGVNITDGLDGLSGGTVAIAFVAYMLIALLNTPAQPNLALLCALIIGALLGFLWFNVHPAQIFIGDSGALLARRDPGRHRADHRPDPRPAADRHHLRARDDRR